MRISLRPILKPKVLLAAVLAVSVALVVSGGLGWYLLPPLDPEPYFSSSASGQLLDRNGARLYVALSRDETWSLPCGSDEMSLVLKQATVSAEDQRFWEHPGVDPLAVLRAMTQNAREAGVASGASTLTM